MSKENTNNIKVVFVDIDNTLLSFTEFVKTTMEKGFRQFGLKPYEPEMFLEFEKVNNQLWRKLEQGQLNLKELEAVRWNMIFERLGMECDGAAFEKFFKSEMFISAIPEPHAYEMMDYLASKYILCAASNGPYEQQLNRLRLGNMYDYFKHYFISEKVGADKPAKAFFDYCFDELKESGWSGLKPEETIIIGDSLSSDMAGGRQYGIKTCYFSRGVKVGVPFEKADYVICDLREIKEIL